MTNLIGILMRIKFGMYVALMSYGFSLTYPTIAIASTTPIGSQESLPITLEVLVSENPPLPSQDIEILIPLEITSSDDSKPNSELAEQVTSVWKLKDVDTTHWAFQAFQSLVKRYGCGLGYPDETFRGTRSLTRYEFAAGLNACLPKIQELLTTRSADLVQQEDLLTVKRMMDDFAPELAELRNRVDTLDVESARLEEQQFSTTTKFSGTATVILGGVFGGAASDANNTTANYQVRLAFNTSFTGSDLLRFSFFASNSRLFNAGNQNIDNVQSFGTPQRIFNSFPSAFSDETHLVSNGLAEFLNDGRIVGLELFYSFPLAQNLFMTIAPGTADFGSLGADLVSLFTDPNSTAFSLFANANPTAFSTTNAGGIGINYRPLDWLGVSIGYAGQESLGQPGGVANPSPSSGIFSGGYTAYANLVLYAGSLTTGLFYMNSYSPDRAIDTLTGGNAAKASTGGFSSLTNDRVSSNHFGVNMTYRVSGSFQIGGWVGYSDAQILGTDFLGDPTGNSGNVQVLNYAITMAFPDLGGSGNLGGLIFGVQPKVIGTSNARVASAIGLQDSLRTDRDTGYHIEAFYRIRINDHISITPGFIWLTAPNHDERNPDAFVTLLRTTFTF